MHNTVQTLIDELRQAGVTLEHKNGKLSVSAGKGVLTPERQDAIRAHRDALLAWLALGGAEQGLCANPDHPVALSPAQVRFWFMAQLQEDLSAYHIVSALRLRGALDETALAAAFDHIIARHESLRTGFYNDDGKPAARLHAAMPCVIERRDLSALAEPEAEVAAAMRAAQRRQFDLATPPLLAVTLLKLRDGGHVLIMVLHHIVADAWSLSVLNREFMQCYGDLCHGRPPALTPLPLQYRDYVAWSRHPDRTGSRAGQLAFWRQELDGLAPVLPLARDFPRAQGGGRDGRTVRAEWSAGLSGRIDALARQHQATPYMVLLTAFHWLLARYSGQDDVAVGTAVANRPDARLENLIGLFLNYLVLRGRVDRAASFAEQLVTTRDRTLRAFAHQDLAFEQMVEDLQLPRSLHHLPLTQINFSYMNALKGELVLPGLTVEPVERQGGLAKFELSLTIRRTAAGTMLCELEFDTGLYREPSAQAMLDDLGAMLESACARPDAPLYSHACGTAVLDTRAEAGDATLHGLFEAQAAATPEATAVALGHASLSYGQLNERANQLAAALREHNLGPHSRIGIALLRTPQLPAAILAVLKIGATYVPLDLQYPAARLRQMAETSAIAAVIRDGEQALAPDLIPAGIVQLDAAAIVAAGRPGAPNPGVPVDPRTAAYCVFTSGSTGVPKAIAMPHASLVNLVRWASEAVPIERGMLQFSSSSFDVHCQEMFMTWYQGKRLEMISADQVRNVAETLHHIKRHQVDTVMLPAPVLEQWGMVYPKYHDLLQGVRHIISTAQALQFTQPLVTMMDALPHCRLHDMYGPAETHVATCKSYERRGAWSAEPSLGHPGRQTNCWILDPFLAPVPDGVVGELYIGGQALAHGYLGAPALTAAKFIPHPFSATPGERLYRTGDLARRLPNGEIKYMGRNDHLIKLRGFRIEPEEIEQQLLAVAGVQQAMVCLAAGAAGDGELRAYVVTAETHLTGLVLKQALQASLPPYMVPGHIFILGAMPLTPNGKVDRERLLAMEVPAAAVRDEVAAGPAETVMLQLWRGLLGHANVGLDDDFFMVGGHSLLATQLVNIVNEHLAIDMPLQAIFEYATVRELVTHLGTQIGGAAAFDAVCEQYLLLQSMSPEELAALEAM
ncbi:amino acid adenylation domain-containing protein [Duganella sp. FT92W]|uniref:Amino acid adenylation domain-containing protein n=1 Tax=Pseudoduganella rivuli TaxID=2666085 RepID=A0A7X2LTH3_9BURK|nr:non-ribosomal peptide synthetase [Pseudoduganella rivuli]MRV71987.1 amino acid adenylation domain-containing protein [Pseudoduganella rivuli]